MKVILSVFLILLLNHGFTTSHKFRILKHKPPPPPIVEKRNYTISSSQFTQQLDHFDSSNTQTFSQRYYVNSEFFTSSDNNVAFLMLGGEGEATEDWMTYGSWVSTGRKYGALMFQLEHRYYGESQPFSDLATENLKYLTSLQFLADAAEFIEAMNEEYSLGSNVKWIAFGGSYAGSLAAWLRLKYPDLVTGAMSSSGPLNAEIDFGDYFQVVVDDLNNINTACVDSLQAAMKQVDDILANPSGSDVTVTSALNLCENVEELESNDINLNGLYTAITYAFALVAQYNGMLDQSLDDLCSILTDESKGQEINRLGELLKLVDGESCIDIGDYESGVQYLQNTDVNQDDRQWFYQSCNEFGWFSPTNREDKIFGRGITLDYFTKQCADVFGSSFDDTYMANQVAQTNVEYKGLDIDISNVVYVHGSVDPWHAVGLIQTTHEDAPAIYIEGASHCATFYDEMEGELQQVTEARNEVDRLIGVWLGVS